MKAYITLDAVADDAFKVSEKPKNNAGVVSDLYARLARSGVYGEEALSKVILCGQDQMDEAIVELDRAELTGVVPTIRGALFRVPPEEFFKRRQVKGNIIVATSSKHQFDELSPILEEKGYDVVRF